MPKPKTQPNLLPAQIPPKPRPPKIPKIPEFFSPPGPPAQTQISKTFIRYHVSITSHVEGSEHETEREWKHKNKY